MMKYTTGHEDGGSITRTRCRENLHPFMPSTDKVVNT